MVELKELIFRNRRWIELKAGEGVRGQVDAVVGAQAAMDEYS